jgi:hypothetical protein
VSRGFCVKYSEASSSWHFIEHLSSSSRWNVSGAEEGTDNRNIPGLFCGIFTALPHLLQHLQWWVTTPRGPELLADSGCEDTGLEEPEVLEHFVEVLLELLNQLYQLVHEHCAQIWTTLPTATAMSLPSRLKRIASGAPLKETRWRTARRRRLA